MAVVPNVAKYDKVKRAGGIGTTQLASNAVTYSKLDAQGRKDKIVFRRSASDTAATDFEVPLGIIDVAGTVTSIKILASSGFGQATNFSSLNIINKGLAGDGTVNVGGMDFNSTNPVVAHVPKALTLNATPANLVVAAGQALNIAKTHTANGQALPTDFIVEVTIERSA